MSAAADYLRELEERRAGHVEAMQAWYAERDRKPPAEFKDSSYLFVRSWAGDQGARPMPDGTVFWVSPDIHLEPAGSPGPMPAEIQAGQTYRVRCAVRNRGDIGAPSAKVELFLTDPTLGFDTRFATNLTLGQVPATWVGAGATSAVEHLWQVPHTEAGHKCLFARVFSFSPLDVPVDPHALDPRVDRHVAQRNLNIVAQGAKYHFKVVHGGTARMRLGFQAIPGAELLRLRHGALEQVVPSRKHEELVWSRHLEVELADGPSGADVEHLGEALRLHVQGDGPGVEERGELLRRAIKLRDRHDGLRRAGRRRLVEQLRELSATRAASTFTARIPDLGLQPGEAAGVHLTAVDEGAEELGAVGGIALVVVG